MNKLFHRHSLVVLLGAATTTAAILVRSRAFKQANLQPLPKLKVELAVKMQNESHSHSVESLLKETVGVSEVHVDLPSQTVVVNGTFVASELVNALSCAGLEVRLTGISHSGGDKEVLVPEVVGDSHDGWSHAVIEFKYHDQVRGLVRLIQVEEKLAVFEAELSGLTPLCEYTLDVHEFGDMRMPHLQYVGKPLFSLLPPNLGRSNEQGVMKVQGVFHTLPVWDLIGRSLLVRPQDASVGGVVVAAVIARSAEVGKNPKRLCACDGTVIWETQSTL